MNGAGASIALTDFQRIGCGRANTVLVAGSRPSGNNSAGQLSEGVRVRRLSPGKMKHWYAQYAASLLV